MSELSALSNDELADQICTWAGRVAAGTATLLGLVREFDAREAWCGPGLLSCAHWLSWRIGLSPGTAREWVRVARRLPDLPDLDAAFTAGRLSWSQVRAVTRVADPDDGIDWIELARHGTAAHLERIVRGIRRAQVVAERATNPDRAAWLLRTRERYDTDGNYVLTITAPAEYAPELRAGLAAQRDHLAQRRAAAPVDTTEPAGDVPAETPTEGVPAGTPAPPPEAEPAPVTDADALLAFARDALHRHQTDHPEQARRQRSHLTTQIDPISGWARLPDGELLPPTSLITALRTLPGRTGLLRLRPLTPTHLTHHDLGRRQCDVTPPLRDLLGSLDGERCRFPGCTRRRKLHAHHVTYWSHGGRTDLANLALLCSRHHTLVHANGYQLTLHPDRRLDVTTADHRPVPHHPAQPWADPTHLDPTRAITAETLPPDSADQRLDLHYAVSVLLHQAA